MPEDNYLNVVPTDITYPATTLISARVHLPSSQMVSVHMCVVMEKALGFLTGRYCGNEEIDIRWRKWPPGQALSWRRLN